MTTTTTTTTRRLAAATALALALALLAGCTGEHGAGTDFWGNPIEDDAAACANPGVVTSPPTLPGADVADELSANDYMVRPPDITPGYSWIMIGVHIRALDAAVPGDGIDFCAPIDVHIEIEALDDGTRLGNSPTGPRVYDFEVATPWINHFIPFEYDPSDPAFAARPPRYHVRVDATYSPDDFPGFAPPALLTCDLTIRTGIVATGRSTPREGPVQCTLTGNVYDRYDQYERP
jgi:hypothetical protein